MISKELKLPDNDRLNSLYPVYVSRLLLDNFNAKYRSDPDKYNIDYRLLDRYPTFYHLIRLIDYGVKYDSEKNKSYNKYTQDELLAIANLVYSLKGSVQSVIKFCNYFDIDVLDANPDYAILNYSAIIDIDNVREDNFNKFLQLFHLLITELLLTGVADSSKIKITTKTLIQSGELENLLTAYENTRYVKYIGINIIDGR